MSPDGCWLQRFLHPDSGRPVVVHIGHHQVVVLGRLSGVAEPRVDNVGRVGRNQFGLPSGPLVLEEFGPGRDPGLLQDTEQAGANVLVAGADIRPGTPAFGPTGAGIGFGRSP